MTELAFEAPLTAAIVKGVVELERTANGVVLHRLPAKARAQNDDPQLAMAEAQPSGVRLAFRTAARKVSLTVLTTRRDFVGMPARPLGVYELYVDGVLAQQLSAEGGRTLRIDMRAGSTEVVDGPAAVLSFDLPAGDKQVEIWLPHNESMVLQALHADAPISPEPVAGRPVWLHHGSSISQGSNAILPTGIWTVFAARRAGVELINLGFGGGALLDPFTARAMRDTAADLISVKLGINVVNADLMRLRAFGPAVHGFLDTIRDGHEATPLLVIGPIHCPIHEETPGPLQFDTAALAEGRVGFVATGQSAEVAAGKLSLRVIRERLKAIVEQRQKSDPNIHYLDGEALYGPDDHALMPLPDRVHPDAATQQMMGERFATLVFEGGVFAPLAAH
ncbi:lipase [Devosia sp. Leaf420]|uniref:SGNH/GDSL hydrolase family protein n=1 Tax=Devosia sp. Leaf420 TaxID=1736374 RepID=UPI000713492B|nr:SGNH/GDSL hydrolase family protein [Devosia sp. Leaf420]KQT50302.1 lipase [Devosia sp. Leaf420]